jgi:predicted small lipoprotein YifL
MTPPPCPTIAAMRAACSLLIVAAYLAGCGAKGPLYLPPKKPAAAKPVPQPLPDPPPERPVPSEQLPAPR